MSEVRRREGAARTEVARAESTQTALARRREEIDGRRRRLEEEAGSLEQRERALAGTAHALGRMLGELKQLKLQLGDQREKREQRLQQLQAQVTRGEVELETLRTELHRRRSRLT